MDNEVGAQQFDSDIPTDTCFGIKKNFKQYLRGRRGGLEHWFLEPLVRQLNP